MRMIPIVSRNEGLLYLNPMYVYSVRKDRVQGCTIITLSSGEMVTSSKPLEEVVKLIEKELSNPQGAD